MAMDRNKAWNYFYLMAITLLFSASPLWAQSTGEKDPKPRDWWGEIETGLISDSNILQDKNQKESDIIWESILYVATQEGEIKWSGLAIFDRYMRNSELSYENYQLSAERLFGDRDYGQIAINISPTAPLDKQDPGAGEPFALGSQSLRVMADHDTERLGNIGLEVAYTRLNYSAPFDPKDTNIITLRPSYFYRIDQSLSLIASYSYELGDAKGGTLLNRQDDISYRAHSLSLEAARILSDKMDTRFRYSIRKKRFTANSSDNIHSGRKDTNHLFQAQISYLPEIETQPEVNIRLFGQFERLWTTSTRSLVEYSENRLTLSVAYSF